MSAMNPPIWTDPERMSGEPCFHGTRVPVRTLFDVLAHGKPIDDFLDQFPTVERDQAVAVLRLAGDHFARRDAVAAASTVLRGTRTVRLDHFARRDAVAAAGPPPAAVA